MKILIPFHSLNNPGGIVNTSEGLYAGLRDLGHEVEVVLLHWKETSKAGKSRVSGRIIGCQGLMYDQEFGFVWPTEKRFPYKGRKNLNRWKGFASKFDLIIWQIPVPTKQKSNFGNSDWLELYNVPVKQIAYIHDGNFHRQYPWLYAIKKHLCGIATTNAAGYNSCREIDLPRALAFSPQMNMEERLNNTPYKARSPGFLSLQTFKAWKHVDDLVRAVPHMYGVDKKLLAGGGLHYYYMTSRDKLRPEYIADKKHDPDLPDQYLGRRIWEVGLEHGMKYLGYIHNDRRDRLLGKVRLLIDSSWSHSFAKQGDHINRVVGDGIIGGCIIVARNFGVSTNTKGDGELLKAGKNYVMVPWDATPKEFADIVSSAANMPKSEYEDMLAESRKVVALFDYRLTAQTFVDMAKGKSAGYYKNRPVGRINQSLKVASDRALATFFAGEMGSSSFELRKSFELI